MSIEGNVLANTLANSAAENAYREAQTTRETLMNPVVEDAQAFAGLANNDVKPVMEPQQVQTVQGNITLNPGDEILNTLQKISDSQANSVNNLLDVSERLKNSETVSMASLLEMQKGLMEFQLKHEVISKSTSSVNQGIQTLFKNQ